MGLTLLEPVRDFYKDEVRMIGKKLGLPDSVIYKQPLPGPGQAIRIIGEITQERLEKQQKADQIVMEEIKKAGLYKKIFQSQYLIKFKQKRRAHFHLSTDKLAEMTENLARLF